MKYYIKKYEEPYEPLNTLEISNPQINAKIASLPKYEDLTLELKMLEDIGRINDYALAYPEKILSDEFAKQRKYLTEDTWGKIYLNLGLNDNQLLQSNKVPDYIKSKITNKSINRTTNDVGNKIGLGMTAGMTAGYLFPATMGAWSAFSAAHPLIAAGVDGALTAHGIYNLFGENGVLKTYNHFKNGEIGKGILSGTVDALDVMGAIGLGKSIGKGINYLYNDEFILAKPLLDLQLPKAARTKIFNNQVTYNNNQLKTLGLPENLNIPEPTYKIYPLKKFFNDDSAALYNASNNIISYGYDSLNPFRAKLIGGIKGITGHEARHAIQQTFGKSVLDGFKLKDLSLKPLYDLGYAHLYKDDVFEALRSFKFNQNTRAASKILTDSNGKYTWNGSLDEFDAELARLRESLNTHKPYTQMQEDTKKIIQSTLSKRFNITPKEVDDIATTLAIEGYKQGGKLKLKTNELVN